MDAPQKNHHAVLLLVEILRPSLGFVVETDRQAILAQFVDPEHLGILGFQVDGARLLVRIGDIRHVG